MSAIAAARLSPSAWTNITGTTRSAKVSMVILRLLWTAIPFEIMNEDIQPPSTLPTVVEV